MTGSLLRRIISRTKVAASNGDRSTTPDHSSPVDTLIHPPLPTSMITKHKISFEEPTEIRKNSLEEIRPQSMANNRKHSYASVREESDAPQSFVTRKHSTESDIPDDFLPRRLPSALVLSREEQDAVDEQENEQVITDNDSDITPESYGSGHSYVDETYGKKRPTSLEDLPDEILDDVFSILELDVTQEDYLRPHADLFSCLLVSKSVHAAALRVLYKHVLIYRSKTFHKLVNTLDEDPALGGLIHSLDFSHYSKMGYGKSRGQTNVTPYLTKESMKMVLNKTCYLKAFLVHEHLDDELDLGVFTTLFSIRNLQAVDFTSCASESFASSFGNLWLNSQPADYTQIKRLCLHECTTLKPSVFEALLPRLGQLTHLDLAHTRVNDQALMSISSSARITHLNLERCTQITGEKVVQFLTQHPAACYSMVWLNLNADASRYRLLSEDNLDALLPGLPSTMRALNIGGSRITSQHVPALRLLATYLEELGLKGAKLDLEADINRILSLPPNNKTKLDQPELKSSLRYIDLTDVKSVTQMSLSYSPISIKDNHSLPLEVIELGGVVLAEIARRNKNIKNPEWTVKELGRRGWYVRSPDFLPSSMKPDNGSRPWKMGARWWGMRKLPMIEQDVGGMYGYYMFKRN